MLIRKHLGSGELAYHYCYVPPGRPVTLTTMVRVACLRWPVEETFEFGEDHFGLDHCQVRLYTAPCCATSCSPWPPSPSARSPPPPRNPEDHNPSSPIVPTSNHPETSD